MPTRIYCPHCITLCQVADEHLGSEVRCHKRGQTFTAQTVVEADLPSTEPIPPTAGSLRLGIAGVTSTGHKRSRNEDSFLIQHLTWFDASQNYQLGLVIVADGVGGQASGDVAAGLAIRTVGGALAPLVVKALTKHAKDVTRRKLTAVIDAALKRANKVVQGGAQ